MSSSSSQLPTGWENRSNRMSEKDIKLGGMAATKFIDRSIANVVNNDNTNDDNSNNDTTAGTGNAYSGDSTGGYQNSDKVRAHYLNRMEQHQQQQQQQANENPFSTNRNNSSVTPIFWEERQEMRQLEAEGLRNKDGPGINGVSDGQASSSASTAVLKSSDTVENNVTCTGISSGSAEVALVRVATYTLETLAVTLEKSTAAAAATSSSSRSGENNNNILIPMEDRSAFAKAIQRAMQALAAAKK